MPIPATTPTFPATIPTSRTFTAPEFPTKEHRAMSGAVYKQLFGNLPSAAELVLEYANVDDATAIALINFWYFVYGKTYPFFLSPEMLLGMQDGLGILTQQGTVFRWFFAERPTLQASQPFTKTVSVKLIGEIAIA